VNHAGAPLLVVDDDEDIREMVAMLLASAGYRVITARDGLDAMAQLQRDGRIALIVLDLMMPRMDGEQFLLTLRAGKHAHIPVVIMSGHGAAWEKARELCANGCLTKPVDLDDLMETVARLASSSAKAQPG
jgi:CheY-like chemotaxis protein